MQALAQNSRSWQPRNAAVTDSLLVTGSVSLHKLINSSLITSFLSGPQDIRCSFSSSVDLPQGNSRRAPSSAPSHQGSPLAAVSQQEPAQTSTASFGYQDVPASKKTGLVGQVFSSVATSYDLMNDLMSVGMHRLWKDKFVRELKPFAGMQHLDVAGGTGDIAFRVLNQITQLEEEQQHQDASSITPAGTVVVCDINPDMLAEGRKKAHAAKYDPQALEFVEGNAESLPFQDQAYDAYTIAFGIRNVTDIPAALREAHRVLKTGGRFLCLEFSHVTLPGLKQIYEAYSFNVIPQIGAAVANDKASYQYLVESIRKFPDQETFASMIRNAGFRNVQYENLQGGIVAIHSGFKLK